MLFVTRHPICCKKKGTREQDFGGILLPQHMYTINVLIVDHCSITFLFPRPCRKQLFYSNNLDLLPPKPKLSFRYLKQGIQEFHRKYVLAPADKAGNNVVV